MKLKGRDTEEFRKNFFFENQNKGRNSDGRLLDYVLREQLKSMTAQWVVWILEGYIWRRLRWDLKK